MPAKRYQVTLTSDDQQEILAWVSKGKAAQLIRARIVLHTDQNPEGPARSDDRMAQALQARRKTVEHRRQTGVAASRPPCHANRVSKRLGSRSMVKPKPI
ncbi:hypothetical protein NKDENANG_02446 [Candidatus Entotheonellaceae bacterium PAL068K]